MGRIFNKIIACIFVWMLFTAFLGRYLITGVRNLTLLKILQWWGFKRPYRDIGNYMGRWWVVPGLVRLHHIKRADRGDLHDHPGDWTTRILSGWYIELDIYGQTHLRSAGDTVSRKAHEFHKIVDVSPEGCWTLFSMPRRINRWGFLVNGVKMPYKQYHRERFEQ